MYFRVDSQQLKKSLFHLKNTLNEKVKLFEELSKYKKQERQQIELQITSLKDLIEEVEFAVYKTKVDTFYLSYEEAKLVRPALLQKTSERK